jgi:sugar/nucleoside kinase (ribokinase family)
MEKDPVCVVGNLNIDLIIRKVPRLPSWGTEVFGDSHVAVTAGQAGYTAFALSRLDVPTSLVGNVGKDAYGEQILDDLKTYGVDTSGIEISQGDQTGITVAIVREDGERGFVSSYGSLLDFNEAMVLRHWDRVEAAAIVCLVGLFATPNLDMAAATRLMVKARQRGKVTMLDTGWDPGNWPFETIKGIKDLLQQMTLFMPNLDEARVITGEKTAEEAAKSLQTLGPKLVVIKCGAEGSFAMEGSNTYYQPPRLVKVFDAVGAGDTFNAGFLYGYRRNWPISDCLAFGNSTASLYISRDINRWPLLSEVAEMVKTYGVVLD